MKRTVSTPHLILGTIFAGIALLWFIGEATNAKLHDTAPGFPLVLIGAGVLGLIASLTNSRTRKRAVAASEEAGVEATEADDDHEDTAVLGENR
jgi:F0F1-type ATP synthase assembly protein I